MEQDLPPHLQALETRMSAFPQDCDIMMLSELDGFLAGIVVCPDQIAPGEWLPVVWGGGDPAVAEGCAFADSADLNAFCQLVVAHYNQIILALQRGPEQFTPLFEIDAESGDIHWEVWLSGFTAAIALRPQAWMAILHDGDEDASTAFATLCGLAGIETEESAFLDFAIQAMLPMAPGMIPFCVEKLHAWRLQRDAGARPKTRRQAKPRAVAKPRAGGKAEPKAKAEPKVKAAGKAKAVGRAKAKAVTGATRVP